MKVKSVKPTTPAIVIELDAEEAKALHAFLGRVNTDVVESAMDGEDTYLVEKANDVQFSLWDAIDDIFNEAA